MSDAATRSRAPFCLNRLVAALYRKYRPQSFEEVVGQEAVVRTLSNAIGTDAVRQAYLFAGPRGTGKTSMARILAKCLNCAQGPTTTPDGTCHACRAIAAGTSLDVIEMDAASQRGIDDIREIRDRVVLQPVEGRYKVYILDEAHQLTDAAWNALLKLIEEPPPHMVVDHDTAGALVFIEQLAEQGQDLGRLVTDLLEHLRHLLLVQHMGHVPESLPVTEETKEALRQQSNQLPEPTVLRLIDLLAVALEDMRQGGDPRLPLELAVVKVTRPHADLSRESLAHRVELLETRSHTTAPPQPREPALTPAQAPRAVVEPEPEAEVPRLQLEQVSDAWARSILESVRERSIPVASLLAEARPKELAGDTLTLEFPAGADFHRRQGAEPQNIGVLRDALYEVTGRKLAVVLETGDTESDGPDESDEPATEEGFISLLKETFDAEEVTE